MFRQKNRNFVLFHAKKMGGFKVEIGKMSSKPTSNHFFVVFLREYFAF